MKRNILTIIISLVLFTSCSRKAITMESLLHELTDRESLARYPEPEYTVRQFSSYDRATSQPGDETWYANWDRSMFIRIEEQNGRKEYVMFDSEGPGSIVRFWMTFAGDNSGLGILRFYLDNQEMPAIEGTAFDILSGNGLTQYPLAASVSEETAYEQRGHNLYLPIPYGKHCKITYESENILDEGAKTGGEAVYYNINYRTYPTDTRIETFSHEEFNKASALITEVCNELTRTEFESDYADRPVLSKNETIAPLGTMSIPMEGPATIQRLRIKIDPDISPELLRMSILEIIFDGEATVWSSLGDFFGTGYQIRPAHTRYISVGDDGTLECRWIMPFREKAEIRLHNLSEDLPIELTYLVNTGDWKWDNRSMHFGCSWHQYTQLQSGGPNSNQGQGGPFDVNFVTLSGKGVYAGDALTVFNTAYAWWGEGDEKVYVDGEEFPSHIGTGSVDYYGYAWCRPEKFTNHPFIGQPDGSGNFWPGYTVNMRHRALDAIPFTSSLRFDMEMWHWTNTVVNYAPVTYWYVIPGGKSNIEPDLQGARAKVALYRSDLIEPVITNGMMEAENMAIDSISGGNITYQTSDIWGWSQNTQVFWTGGSPGDRLELSMISDTSRNTHLTARFTVAPDYGTVRVYWNGKLIPGTINLYNPEVSTREIYLGRQPLLHGNNNFTVEIASEGQMQGKAFFGLDLLKFAQ